MLSAHIFTGVGWGGVGWGGVGWGGVGWGGVGWGGVVAKHIYHHSVSPE